jgi:hypothetical protein
MSPDSMPTKKSSGCSLEQWEVRSPLRYGSKHVGYFPSEADARSAAVKLSIKDYDGAGLQIHTAKRCVYIDHNDD